MCNFSLFILSFTTLRLFINPDYENTKNFENIVTNVIKNKEIIVIVLQTGIITLFLFIFLKFFELDNVH